MQVKQNNIFINKKKESFLSVRSVAFSICSLELFYKFSCFWAHFNVFYGNTIVKISFGYIWYAFII